MLKPTVPAGGMTHGIKTIPRTDTARLWHVSDVDSVKAYVHSIWRLSLFSRMFQRNLIRVYNGSVCNVITAADAVEGVKPLKE